MGFTRSRSNGQVGPKPTIPKSANIYEADVVEMARQICIIEFELFNAIPLREFLTKSWSKAELQKTSPNIWSMIDRFNKFSCWICFLIVSEPNLKKRAAVVLKLIRLAKVKVKNNECNLSRNVSP